MLETFDQKKKERKKKKKNNNINNLNMSNEQNTTPIHIENSDWKGPVINQFYYSCVWHISNLYCNQRLFFVLPTCKK